MFNSKERGEPETSVLNNRFASVTQNQLAIKNKNIKMSSFKSSENIQKKEGRPDRSVSDN